MLILGCCLEVSVCVYSVFMLVPCVCCCCNPVWVMVCSPFLPLSGVLWQHRELCICIWRLMLWRGLLWWRCACLEGLVSCLFGLSFVSFQHE